MKVVVGRDAPVEVASPSGIHAGWSLLVPPGLPNSATAHGAYSALFVDPGQAALERTDRVLDLGRRRGEWLLEELDAEAGGHHRAARIPAGLADVLGPDQHPVGAALRRMTSTTTIGDLAARLGVSPQHVRRMLREHAGTTFGAIMRWHRLREAIALLPRSPIARAGAESGFADQAHLTRTSTAMLGRTPGTF
ncbi:helix-turn-helix transcriptional regulator [Georgenia alba]|uniref:Helix-turn-helix transcriptional regulator n=1 Tax=Georgenia alba TaxID=2233858 RepID=A0ABW2Q4C5_9MICO